MLAIGRCADITEIGGLEAGGTARSYVMITDRRLRWIPFYDLEYESMLDLDSVKDFTERTAAHRYAISLQHAPLRRRRIAPELEPEFRAVLRAKGLLHEGTGPFTRTELAFSHRDTAAARTLRESLASRLGP